MSKHWARSKKQQFTQGSVLRCGTCSRSCRKDTVSVFSPHWCLFCSAWSLTSASVPGWPENHWDLLRVSLSLQLELLFSPHHHAPPSNRCGPLRPGRIRLCCSWERLHHPVRTSMHTVNTPFCLHFTATKCRCDCSCIWQFLLSYLTGFTNKMYY